MNYIKPFISIINEMSPFLLIGFLFAGILHVYVPKNLFAKYLSKNSFSSLFWASLLGVPLPLCSCGVLPTAISLNKDGASRGATTSFLIATPQTSINSMLATYGILGLPFAILRPLVAFITAIFAGTIVNFATKNDKPIQTKEVINSHCHNKNNKSRSRIYQVLNYAFVDMLQSIGKWLIIGLLVAGLITLLVPNSFFQLYADSPFINMLLILLFSIPMYLCSTGSIPIAAALILKGISPGGALVLLMAGPATNISSMILVGKFMGKKTLFIYLSTIIIGALGFGILIDTYTPLSQLFEPLLHLPQKYAENSFALWKTISSILLFGLIINAFILKRRHIKHITNI